MSTNTIKHLVISGGGPTGIITYGAAAHLAKAGVWSLANIKSIYGCSVGAYIGTILSLGYEWAWLDDYLIKRPWEKLVTQSAIGLLDVYQKKGLINETFYTEAIRPLLAAKDIDEAITLQQFYEYNKIELHFYAADINTPTIEKVDLSYKTHPNLSLIKALRMTMAVPIIFQPVFEGEGCYIDGGLLNNFPLNDCIAQTQCDPDEILAFRNIWNVQKQVISENSSMLDFFLILLKKTQASFDSVPQQADIKNIVRCFVDDIGSFETWLTALSQEDMRRKLVEKGREQAEAFLGGSSPSTPY